MRRTTVRFCNAHNTIYRSYATKITWYILDCSMTLETVSCTYSYIHMCAGFVWRTICLTQPLSDVFMLEHCKGWLYYTNWYFSRGFTLIFHSIFVFFFFNFLQIALDCVTFLNIVARLRVAIDIYCLVSILKSISFLICLLKKEAQSVSMHALYVSVCHWSQLMLAQLWHQLCLPNVKYAVEPPIIQPAGIIDSSGQAFRLIIWNPLINMSKL